MNYGGTSITYDEIGNPETIGDKELVWKGRELISYTDEGTTVSYGYNADGIRTYKEINNGGQIERHEYVLSGSQIVKETVFVNGVEQYILVYVYDELGAPIGIKYRTPTYAENVYTCYFFEKNLQGDIVAIYNASGTKIGTYTYDAWGNGGATMLNASGVDRLILLSYNPFRYRGYYHDFESGWYYLQSRYYDANWGRFISADSFDVLTATPDQLTDKNIFAYCDNNPIMRGDADGEFWHILAGAALGVVAQYASDVVSNLVSGKSLGESLTQTSSWVDYLAAAASGALAASGVGVVGSKIINTAIEGTAYVANCIINDEEINSLELTVTMGLSFFTSKKGVNGANLRGVYNRSKQVIKTTNSLQRAAKYLSKISDVKTKVVEHIGDTFGDSFKSGVWNGIKQLQGIDLYSYW